MKCRTLKFRYLLYKTVFIAAVLSILPVLLGALTAPFYTQNLKYQDQIDITKDSYKKIKLEDFEKKTLSVLPDMDIRSDYPAPVPESSQYVRWQIFRGKGHSVEFNISQNAMVTHYVRSFSIWIYGTFLPGKLYVLVKDVNSDFHLIEIGNLKFRGWREMSVDIPDHVVQQTLTLNEKTGIQFMRIIFHPGINKGLKEWQHFYMDDISLSVREKFLLPPEIKR